MSNETMNHERWFSSSCMSTDDLLSHAAVTAGKSISYYNGAFYDTTAKGDFLAQPTWHLWNPLDNGDDALELAIAMQWVPSRKDLMRLPEEADRKAAIRRMIVAEAAARDLDTDWGSPYNNSGEHHE